MYTAMQIAAAVIKLYAIEKQPITNLKLQKVLFYIQAKSFLMCGEPIFQDEIEAWRHGPVIRDVYNAFCPFISFPLDEKDILVRQNLPELDDTSFYIVYSTVKETIPYSAWELVDKTKKTKVWKDSYESNKYNIISKESIKKYNIVTEDYQFNFGD